MQNLASGLQLADSAKVQWMRRIILIPSIIVLAILAWAWIGGGREPLHEITQPIPVPERAR